MALGSASLASHVDQVRCSCAERALELKRVLHGGALARSCAYRAYSRRVISLLLAGTVGLMACATRLRAQSQFDSTALAEALAAAAAQEDSPLVIVFVPPKSPWVAKVAAALRSRHRGLPQLELHSPSEVSSLYGIRNPRVHAVWDIFEPGNLSVVGHTAKVRVAWSGCEPDPDSPGGTYGWQHEYGYLFARSPSGWRKVEARLDVIRDGVRPCPAGLIS